jgi:fumarate reductase subunit C
MSKTIAVGAGTALAPLREARRQLLYELVSGVSGFALAVFMWGHMFLVGSILTGAAGFNWVANSLEVYYIAQPTVLAVFALFLIHAAMASRKIPAQLRERRRMLALARELRRQPVLAAASTRGDPRLQPHLESLLWIWQVRTGMIILVLGSFHIVLLALDIFTPLFGERTGIEAASTFARVQGGLWGLYAILLLCVEFHASAGLYRLAVKWGAGARLARETVWRVEHVILWSFLGLGFLALLVLAGWLEPPLAFVLEEGL